MRRKHRLPFSICHPCSTPIHFLIFSPSSKYPIIIYMCPQDSLKAFYKQLYTAYKSHQLSHNQFSFSCGACGNWFPPFLISYKILVEPSEGFSHFLNGPSANDLVAQAFSGVCYLVFLRACVFRCLIYFFFLPLIFVCYLCLLCW